MSFMENFALGFTYLSPVVGVYSVFAFGLAAGGPPMIWSYGIAGLGQLLVALVFGEIVSQFPITGGLYPWCRRLVGPRWGWMAGWIYGWALFVTVAAVAVGAGPFLALLLGFAATPLTITAIALILVAIATSINLCGTKILARVAYFGFLCELAGALVVGCYLLIFARVNPLGIILDPGGAAAGGSYLGAFLAAALVGLYSCYGFEACADVAEETPRPEEAIPRAMRMTIYVGVGASIFICFALILATPDIGQVVSGSEKDPIGVILTSSFGPVGAKAVAVVVLVSFISCVLSLQAAASRLLFAFGRDRRLFLNEKLAALSATTKVPGNALVVAGMVPALIVVLGHFLQDALTTIISFAVVGIYLSFQMAVVAALVARSRGWAPSGPFRLGKWGWPVNVAALAYGVLAIVNLVWPRTPGATLLQDYSLVLVTMAIVLAGGIVMTTVAFENEFRPAEDDV